MGGSFESKKWRHQRLPRQQPRVEWLEVGLEHEASAAQGGKAAHARAVEGFLLGGGVALDGMGGEGRGISGRRNESATMEREGNVHKTQPPAQKIPSPPALCNTPAMQQLAVQAWGWILYNISNLTIYGIKKNKKLTPTLRRLPITVCTCLRSSTDAKCALILIPVTWCTREMNSCTSRSSRLGHTLQKDSFDWFAG